MRQIRTDIELLARAMMSGMPEADRVLVAWPLACGAKAAAKTAAESYSGGVLRVRVEERSWRDQMRALVPQLREHLYRVTAVKVADILFLSGKEMVERKPWEPRPATAADSMAGRRKKS